MRMLFKKKIQKFSQVAKEKLKYYVYCLVDPRTKKIFYIGKGKNDRVFYHVKSDSKTDKGKLIKEIISTGKAPELYIVRHGLEEKEAFHVEGALIDLLKSNSWTKKELKNIIAGYCEFDYGMKTVEEVNAHYAIEKLNKEDIKHNVLIININKSYVKEEDIYEATRKSWVVSKKQIKKIDIVITEYKGVFRKVYKPEKWIIDKRFKGNNRLMFKGSDVSEEKEFIPYINKQSFRTKGIRNPILYVWGNKS